MATDIREENISEATTQVRPHLGPGLYSGNFQGIRERGELVAVFCLTRGGSLHVQSGDRIDLARAIVDGAKSEKMAIRGVLSMESVGVCRPSGVCC